MDSVRAKMFMGQVITQTGIAVAAIRRLDTATKAQQTDVEGIFRNAQEIVSAAGMMSKLFWSPGRRTSAVTRARCTFLQQELKVNESSILFNRSVRNALEHLDERLDEYLAFGYFVDGNIGPEDIASFGDEPARHVRRFEGTTLTVMGDSVDCVKVVDEMVRIGTLAREWVTTAQATESAGA